MKSMRELRKAVTEQKPLVWNDPEPIPGNDYRITYIEPLKAYFDKDTPIIIRYNNDQSEAEVYVREIEYQKDGTN